MLPTAAEEDRPAETIGELLETFSGLRVVVLLKDEVVVALWPNGVTCGVVVVKTVLLYPNTPARPYPSDPAAYRYTAQ